MNYEAMGSLVVVGVGSAAYLLAQAAEAVGLVENAIGQGGVVGGIAMLLVVCAVAGLAWMFRRWEKSHDDRIAAMSAEISELRSRVERGLQLERDCMKENAEIKAELAAILASCENCLTRRQGSM
jgi:hypothetical protein